MPREASDATKLRNAIARERVLRQEVERERLRALHWSDRAKTAEAALAAWQVRFDALLKIVPSDKGG